MPLRPGSHDYCHNAYKLLVQFLGCHHHPQTLRWGQVHYPCRPGLELGFEYGGICDRICKMGPLRGKVNILCNRRLQRDFS